MKCAPPIAILPVGATGAASPATDTSVGEAGAAASFAQWLLAAALPLDSTPGAAVPNAIARTGTAANAAATVVEVAASAGRIDALADVNPVRKVHFSSFIIQ